MLDFLRNILSTDFVPHAYCLRIRELVWLDAGADAMVAVSYCIIPVALLRLVRARRDLVYPWLFGLFAAFILSCGATHVLGAVVLWLPIYRLEAIVKTLAAAASLPTAILFWRMVPALAHVPGPAEWRAKNEALESEIARRVAAERRIQALNLGLEARVTESTLRLAAIVESSDNAIIGKKLDGTVTSWNLGGERLFGYTAKEMIGQSISQVIPEDLKEDEEQLMARLRAGERVEHHVTRRVTKGGQEIVVSLTLSPLLNSQGEIVGAATIAYDITEQRKAEEALRLSEERQRLAVEAGDIGLFFWDGTPGPMVWTERCKTLFGLAPDHPNPSFMEFVELIHVEDRDRLRGAMLIGLDEGQSFEAEFQVPQWNGNSRWVKVSGRARGAREGGASQIHGAVIDLTAAKETEQALRRANAELEQFAYIAAHDLQEPLRNVSLSLGLLEEAARGQLHQEANEYLGCAVDSAHRMHSMIKDILAYARAVDEESRKRSLARTSTVGALDKALDNLRPAILECKAAISWGALPLVHAEEGHLIQIFQNLISNALKYRGTAQPRVHIDATVEKGRCLFSITDNGIGIPAEYRERVFGLFKRLHDGSIPGTGIGLPLCRRIVAYYGGRIWIESTEGQGTTFWFTLPAEGGTRELRSRTSGESVDI